MNRKVNNFEWIYYIENILSALLIFIFLFSIPTVYASTAVHDNVNPGKCNNCHISHISKSTQQAIDGQKNVRISAVNYVSQPSGMQAPAGVSVTGNITLITSPGQNWFQQGIYGPTTNTSLDQSW
ncbi:MAG TPA: hypothetical protein VIO11_02245, partial [Candidatus Methanoperedens sp.]